MIRHLSIVAALVLAAATSAQAQNNKPVRSGTLYEDRSYLSNSQNSLTLKYSQTPTDKYLTITNVNCVFQYGNGQVLLDVTVKLGTYSGGDDIGRTFSIAGGPFRSANFDNYVGANLNASNLMIKVGPGRYPAIDVNTWPNSSGVRSTFAACTIVGTLSDT